MRSRSTTSRFNPSAGDYRSRSISRSTASLSLARAHEIADALEAALRDELGPKVEVDTHIEPLQTRGLAGRDAPAERIAQVQAALAELAAKSGSVRDVHDVRVRETYGGRDRQFPLPCRPGLTVTDVHDKVDDLERALKLRFPSIKRVIGHAEPRVSR